MHSYHADRAYEQLRAGAALTDLPLPYELALIGAIVWIVAYILFINRGLRDRASAMPVVAVCLNITWEFVYTFIWPPPPPSGPILLPIRLAWFVLDVVILSQVIQWGARDQPPLIAKWFRVIVISALLLALAGHIGFADSFKGVDPSDQYAAGHYEAYLLNLVMSILFCLFVLQREPQIRGISLWGGVAKLVGTGLYSIAATLLYIEAGCLIDGLLLPLLFLSILVFDVLYILLIVNEHARARAIAVKRGLAT